jgi:gas vesicle protein
MKRTAFVVALIALVVGSVSAQEKMHHAPDPAMMEAHKQLMGTLKEYARASVLPQLSTWKGQLDGAMTPEDLQKLNILRARAAELRDKGINQMRTMRDAWTSENYDQIKAMRQQMKEIREEHRALLEELKPLAEKYRSTLESIGQEAKPKVQNWKEEGKAIVEKWVAEHKDELGDMPHHMGGMMHGFGHEFGGMGKGMRGKMMAAHFMLWDGTDFIDKMEQGAPGMMGPEGMGLE